MRIFKIDEQYLVLWCSACSYAFDSQSFKVIWFINHDVTHDFLVTLYYLDITLRHRLSHLHIKQI